MILNHKEFHLHDKRIFERVVLRAPFKISNPMPNEACFLYVLSGEYTVNSAVNREKLKPQDAVLMKCGLYFSEWLESSDYKQCEAIAVHLYPDVLKKIYEHDIPQFIREYKKTDNPVSMYKVAGDTLIDNYIQSMKFYFENPTLVDDELLTIKLKEIILLLLKTEKAASVMEVVSGLFSPKEYSFKEIIDAHLFSNLSVGELAQLANLSVSSFKREFARLYNDSPAHYLKNKKIEKAEELLVVSDSRISDIAFECGFNEVAHFSKSFREKHGVSPTTYRLTQKREVSAAGEPVK